MSSQTAAKVQVNGILNCFKPPRVTSRVIVDAVQRDVRPAKVGHAGTLDPLAEGVLVVAVGSASRLIPYLHLYSKTYLARFELGCWSDSADLETDVIQVQDAPIPTLEQIQIAAQELVGKIEQVPPLYSAVKVGGKRAYEAARNQQLLELTARTVEVHRIEVLNYEYPSLWLEIECGTGTYIRSLAIDLAKRLGTRGLMSHLVRSAIGPFKLEDAIRVDKGLPNDFQQVLHPMAIATTMLPSITLTESEWFEVENGRTIRFDEADLYEHEQEIAAYDQRQDLRAIMIRRVGGLGPKRVFK